MALINYHGDSKVIKKICDVINGFKVNEISDVDINTQTLANNQVLKYDSSSQKWVNGSGGGGGGESSTLADLDDVSVGTATNGQVLTYDSANQVWKNSTPENAVQSDWNETDDTKPDFIKNKPTVPSAQVNSDWNATSGVAEILHKPTIPTVNDNTITIQENGNNVDTFTLNQSSNKTIDIPVNQSYYGTCTDNGDVINKSVTISNQNFKLAVGAIVSVRFSNANSASNVTLDVNNTGAKAIYYSNAVYTGTSATVCGNANNTCTYLYDGTNWVWLSHGADNNTTYSAMSTSELTTGTATNSRVVRADYLKTGINSLIDDKINALDVTGDSNISASKTIKSWSETNGKVSVTTQDIQIGESQVTNLTTDLSGKASSTHTHGNIQNGGTLQTTDVGIASGDKLVITDASDSDKVARTSTSFDGTTTTTALTPKGTFETFSKLTLGTSSSTAYRGDRGSTAYSHATDSGRLTTATSSGLYKVASTNQGHIASLTAVEKADITGLGIPDTDTKNTAGSTNSSSKLFLIGATSQATNPQTYSHDTAYVGTDGKLYSNSKEVVNLSDSQDLTNKTYNGYTLGSACAKDVASSGNASATQVVMGNDTRLTDSRTPSSHTHGNIQNGGTLQTNDVAIANGDKLVVTDASNSNKIARTSVAFDGNTTTTALTPKGTFETFVQDASYVHTDNNYTTTEKNKLSGLATVATSGSYNDLSNKPTIPTNLNGLSDVTTSSLKDKQILYYDSASSAWKNSTGLTLRGSETIDRQDGTANTKTPPETDATVGTSYITLGNNTPYSDAGSGAGEGNSKGLVRFYGSGAYRIDLTTKDGTVNGNRKLYLPYVADGKTLAITDDITSAINALDVTGASSISASKTISAWSETDGKVSVSTQDISITKSQVSDFPTSMPVSQTLTNSGDKNYRLLFTNATPSATTTDSTRFSTRLLFNTSTKLLLTTDGTYRSGISPNYVYVGNPSDMTGSRLYASGTQDFWLQASGEANYGVKIGVYETTPAWAFAPMTNNALRLGSPSLKWSVVYATNSAINTSDRNEKEDIVDLDKEFSKDFIMDLKPVSYKRIEGDRTHYGLIAQDVEDTLTKFNLTSMDFGGLCKDQKTEQIYYEDEEGNPHYRQEEIEGEYSYGLRYEEFIAPLIKTVQQQQEEIESLKAEISELKKLWAQSQS